MKHYLSVPIILSLLFAVTGCGKNETSPDRIPKKAMVFAVYVDGIAIPDLGTATSVNVDNPSIAVEFTSPAYLEDGDGGCISFSGGKLDARYGRDSTIIIFSPAESLASFKEYTLSLNTGKMYGLKVIAPYSIKLCTAYDNSEKFPRITTDELMTLVQRRTFKYFWDYAHPSCGLARERLGSGDTVTSGGSGFGLMAIIAAIERGFISRADGYARLLKIATFLSEKAERFHGAFSHWLNGSSGAAIAFSTYDNGADLVETSFLMEGLLACRNYFSEPAEAELREKITALWEAVEWDWFLRDGKLYWHWSPNYDWQMNMAISGWNEALITYVLAASSPTHPISKADYESGWARGGGIRNGKKFYGIYLPLGSDYGGPLFFTHYSFLGLDPRGLSDKYANYWEQNVAHARINQAYCAANPKGYAGYSEQCWGLTASDIPNGYTASSPTNDKGVIAPTAALSSMPYTPEGSIAALETFYYIYGDRLFGQYGFHDAFSLSAHWFADSYIAIDQGPIVVMIENYRSGAVWDAFMKDPDVTSGLAKLGFSRQ